MAQTITWRTVNAPSDFGGLGAVREGHRMLIDGFDRFAQVAQGLQQQRFDNFQKERARERDNVSQLIAQGRYDDADAMIQAGNYDDKTGLYNAMRQQKQLEQDRATAEQQRLLTNSLLERDQALKEREQVNQGLRWNKEFGLRQLLREDSLEKDYRDFTLREDEFLLRSELDRLRLAQEENEKAFRRGLAQNEENRTQETYEDKKEAARQTELVRQQINALRSAAPQALAGIADRTNAFLKENNFPTDENGNYYLDEFGEGGIDRRNRLMDFMESDNSPEAQKADFLRNVQQSLSLIQAQNPKALLPDGFDPVTAGQEIINTALNYKDPTIEEGYEQRLKSLKSTYNIDNNEYVRLIEKGISPQENEKAIGEVLADEKLLEQLGSNADKLGKLMLTWGTAGFPVSDINGNVSRVPIPADALKTAAYAAARDNFTEEDAFAQIVREYIGKKDLSKQYQDALEYRKQLNALNRARLTGGAYGFSTARDNAQRLLRQARGLPDPDE